MDCFVRHIESPEEGPVRGEFRNIQFHPFTLLALSGFADPPLRSEVRTLIDLTFALASREKIICMWRISEANECEFVGAADSAFDRIDIDFQRARNRPWRRGRLYLLRPENAIALADVLISYWKTWYGSWLFADWPEDASADLSRLLQSHKQLGELRAALLHRRRFVILTFDDNLYDIYASWPMEHVVSTLRSIAETHGVSFVFKDS